MRAYLVSASEPGGQANLESCLIYLGQVTRRLPSDEIIYEKNKIIYIITVHRVVLHVELMSRQMTITPSSCLSAGRIMTVLYDFGESIHGVVRIEVVFYRVVSGRHGLT